MYLVHSSIGGGAGWLWLVSKLSCLSFPLHFGTYLCTPWYLPRHQYQWTMGTSFKGQIPDIIFCDLQLPLVKDVSKLNAK